MGAARPKAQRAAAPPAETLDPSAAEVVDRVLRAARDEEWFPDLRYPLRAELVLLHERTRCTLHRIRLRGPGGERDVLLKRRFPGGLSTAAVGPGRRPSMSPALALSEQERAALELTGLRRAASAVALEPRTPDLVAVRPLLLLEEQAGLVMDLVPWPTLGVRLRAERRGRRDCRSAALPAVGAAAGQWLRRVHAVDPGAVTRSRLDTAVDVADLVVRFADHLALLRGERPLFGRLRAVAAVLAEELPDVLPTAVLHGDFAPRNLLVSPSGTVAVIDPMPTWRAPVHEDVARMVAGVRLMRLQLVSGGLAVGAHALEGFDTAFRKAYYGEDEPALEVAAFGLLVALDHWSAQLARLSSGSGPLRRAPRPVMGWLERAVVAEVRRQVDAVERLVPRPATRPGPAGTRRGAR